jgi:hypothetical protein
LPQEALLDKPTEEREAISTAIIGSYPKELHTLKRAESVKRKRVTYPMYIKVDLCVAILYFHRMS